MHLGRLDIRDCFDAVVCAGGAIAAKPEPDVYLAACAALNVDPAEALAIEDSPHGITAAKRAGLWCVALALAGAPVVFTRGLDHIAHRITHKTKRTAMAR